MSVLTNGGYVSVPWFLTNDQVTAILGGSTVHVDPDIIQKLKPIVTCGKPIRVVNYANDPYNNTVRYDQIQNVQVYKLGFTDTDGLVSAQITIDGYLPSPVDSYHITIEIHFLHNTIVLINT